MSDLLKGIRIIDLTRLQPGPYCTMALGDLGAEVIKVENPQGGDYIRWYPPLGKSESGYFLALNRNKKSVRLNLWTEAGKDIFLRLLDTADILIEQYRPGTLDKIGLGYDELASRNPGLIMISISAYGQTGPYSSMAGHDINMLCLAGILSANGSIPGRPVIPPVQIADMAGSLWAAVAILAALLERNKSGQGQYIDVSLLESVFSFQTLAAGAFFVDGHIPQAGGEPLNGVCAWYNIYPTSDDQYLAVGLLEYKFWRVFCKVLGCEDFIELQFAPRGDQAMMIEEIEKITSRKSLQEWLDIFSTLDLCITPVNNLQQALNDPQLSYRQLVQECYHPVEGSIQQVGIPVQFSRTPASIRLPPPLFGEHTEEILHELGLTRPMVEELKSIGAI